MEEVEDIIFNLIEGVDVAETEAKINEYKRMNKRVISLNASKKEEERKQISSKVREKNIALREENKVYYEHLEEDEKMEIEEDKDNKYKQMAEQFEMNQKVRLYFINYQIFQYSSKSLTQCCTCIK